MAFKEDAMTKVDPVQVIESLNGQFDDNFLELARALRDLNEIDPNAFVDIVKKYKIGRRKAYYLVEIDKAFRGLKVNTTRLRNVGWTKLQLIAPHVTQSNVLEMLKLAETNKVKDLADLVNGKQPTNNDHAITLYFSAEDYAMFQDALVAHGGQRSGRGIINKEEALMDLIKKART